MENAFVEYFDNTFLQFSCSQKVAKVEPTNGLGKDQGC